MKIHLRNLYAKDAEGMLEWMTDPEINRFFRFDSTDINVEDCLNFIKHSMDAPQCRHFAIADDSDDYLGTISLKNINFENFDAEYAISCRQKVHGTGVAYEATRQILEYAKDKLGLKEVYLNVLVNNKRANAFYKKCGFSFITLEKNAVEIKNKKYSLNWYRFCL